MEQTIKAYEIFKSVYGNSVNFITPRTLDYGFISKNHVYELSTGRGIDFHDLFGITVVSKNRINAQWYRTFELSKVFCSKKSAFSYVEDLKERFKND